MGGECSERFRLTSCLRKLLRRGPRDDNTDLEMEGLSRFGDVEARHLPSLLRTLANGQSANRMKKMARIDKQVRALLLESVSMPATAANELMSCSHYYFYRELVVHWFMERPRANIWPIGFVEMFSTHPIYRMYKTIPDPDVTVVSDEATVGSSESSFALKPLPLLWDGKGEVVVEAPFALEAFDRHSATAIALDATLLPFSTWFELFVTEGIERDWPGVLRYLGNDEDGRARYDLEARPELAGVLSREFLETFSNLDRVDEFENSDSDDVEDSNPYDETASRADTVHVSNESKAVVEI